MIIMMVLTGQLPCEDCPHWGLSCGQVHLVKVSFCLFASLIILLVFSTALSLKVSNRNPVDFSIILKRNLRVDLNSIAIPRITPTVTNCWKGLKSFHKIVRVPLVASLTLSIWKYSPRIQEQFKSVDQNVILVITLPEMSEPKIVSKDCTDWGMGTCCTGGQIVASRVERAGVNTYKH